MASRETFWNIQFGGVVYLIGFVLMVVVAYALIRRLRIWRLGSEDKRLTNITGRFKTVVVRSMIDGLWHRRIVRDRYAGVMHVLLFGGFGLLLMGPFLDAISEHVYKFLEGNVYLAFSLMLDIGGILVLAGVGMAAYRRYVIKPSKLDSRLDDGATLALLALIIVSGFMLEGLRMAVTELDAHPGWAVWSPGGYVFAVAFHPLGDNVNLALHQELWWTHMLVSMGTMGYVFLSFPKMAHVFTAPLNMFLKTTGGKGVLKPIEISEESTDTLGASKIEDLTWKDLIDLDACTRCGRCQEVCPAYLTHKPLSPKKLIQELRADLHGEAPALLKGKRAAEGRPTLVGDVVSEDEVWACTTCGACEEACPVYVEPINKIVAMRRNLVLEQGSICGTVMASLRSIQDRGHPWKGAAASRVDWASELNIKTANNDGNAGILFWVGCTAAVQERTMKIPQAVAKLAAAAGVEMSFLGHEESCCGHFARRIGDEYLFQCQAQQNIETLKRYNIKKIVTACPHCYHTLKDEYPQFGGDFEVVHHTEFLLQLIKEGKLQIKTEVAKTVTYQDPCYLGRYHGMYEGPREILTAIPGVNLVEMEGCGSRSLCCGAGGGRMWIEEEPEQRVSLLRAKDAAASGSDTVATACPFCLQMLQDAVAGLGLEEPMEVLDLAELLERAVLLPDAAVEPSAREEVKAVGGPHILSSVGGG
ncbi:MAG: heterodisulfide reductase-related iron-sulfur binding cluster [Dehalococcoidia bacterium]